MDCALFLFCEGNSKVEKLVLIFAADPLFCIFYLLLQLSNKAEKKCKKRSLMKKNVQSSASMKIVQSHFEHEEAELNQDKVFIWCMKKGGNGRKQ